MKAGGVRVIRSSSRYTLFADRGTTYAAVEAIRLRADELADAIADVDAFLHETDTTIASWWFTERSTPAEDVCLAAGLVKDEADYLHAAMLLTTAPPPAEIEARALVDVDDYVEARRLMQSAFANPHFREKSDAELAAEYEHEHDTLFAAWVDGRMASVGRATFTSVGVFLSGGATLEWARGRGAYRAVVRARWDAAVERGTPVLGVGAGRMSRPILERLGFEQVLQYRRLETRR